MNNRDTITIEVPAAVQWILTTLKKNGYEAYIVGGCVRDALLGREPEDWDITTSALPFEVKSLFHNTVDTGIQHGTVMVIKDGVGYEVTTYRVDGEYKDSRHPSSVTFTRSLQEDLKRRDFTINAFAWDEEGLIDLFDGLSDLHHRLIRCVGDPDLRFSEDALRIMRAVRFSAQLGFEIEEQTGAMISAYAKKLSNISVERIRVEWEKTLLSRFPEMVYDYADYGLESYIVPEGYQACFDRAYQELLQQFVPQGEEDREQVKQLRLAAFFCPLTVSQADQAFRYLKYDNATRKAVTDILTYKEIQIPPERQAVKEHLNRMGYETFLSVLEFQKGAVKCFDSWKGMDGAAIEQVQNLLEDILKSREPWQISQLVITGRDLIAAGVPQGEKVGKFLKIILQKVMQSPTLNNREVLCSPDFLSEVENEFRRSL